MSLETNTTEVSAKEIIPKPHKRDDELWKGILDDVFEDFLRFFFLEADELFDFNKKFTFLDKEFNRLFQPEEDAAGVRFVDKLVKVHLKFTAFAILIDDVKSHHPKIYKEEYLGTRLSYEFNTYKLLEQDEEALRANPNPFAIVALTVLLALKNKKISDEGLKRIKLDLTYELIKRNLDEVKYDKIWAFLAYYVNFKNRKMMIRFEKEVEQLTGRTTPMGVKEILLERREKIGIEKGIEKGKLEGRHEEALEIALEMKKDKFPIEKIAKLTKLTIKEIETL